MSEYLQLKKSNCRNCYKCIRHCPVKSIRFSGNQAHILPEECILCGQCFVVCPQDAKVIKDSTEVAKVLIGSGTPVYVSLAPSFMANYDDVGINGMTEALKKLGFAGVEETALGATLVASEYERLLSEKKPPVLISSCCPTVNLLIQKYFPNVLPYLADVVTPMNAHCMDLKRRYPGCKTVFIGPCLSKKDEADRVEGVDCVLTFAELTRWMSDSGVELSGSAHRIPESRARLFPVTGGIIQTMQCDQDAYTYLAVDGIENCIDALRDIESGKVTQCFVEMSACKGSCVGGPIMEKYHDAPVRDYKAVVSHAGEHPFRVEEAPAGTMRREYTPLTVEKKQFSEAEIRATLARMGKTTAEQELNCGSCGYDTCREKAVAVLQGKADLTMCLPFLKEKAESFSDLIVGNTPFGIVVCSEELEVQQINRAALDFMNLRAASDVMGGNVDRILEPEDFHEVRRSGQSIRDRRSYFAAYRKYAEMTLLFDQESHVYICILRDVTDEETARERKETVDKSAAEIADRVVERQMRVVQDIASLLGETAAETKVAISKLKETIHADQKQ